MLAPGPITDQLRELALEFLLHMRDGDYDHVWNHLAALDGMELISTTSFPLHILATGDIDGFLRKPSSTYGMALAFQQNTVFPGDNVGVRTAFFQGVAGGLERMNWFELFENNNSLAFVKARAAVLVADTAKTRTPLFLPFIDEGGRQYKIDLESLAAFSMVISAQKLHRLATRAMEIGEERTALTVYELAARLSGAYTRLRQLTWDHPIVKLVVTEKRRQELQSEYAYTTLAEEQVAVLLGDPRVVTQPVDVGAFLRETFKGYNSIVDVELDDQDLQRVVRMNDDDLRHAIAKVLIGVDPVEAEREARKPHTAVEIADMEVTLRREHELYHLVMPFKSGREIREGSVPVDVFYQIFRAHLFFEKGIVVFITAKPCSQSLHNLVKMARDRKGWAMGVIEHQDLARLLKVNGLL